MELLLKKLHHSSSLKITIQKSGLMYHYSQIKFPSIKTLIYFHNSPPNHLSPMNRPLHSLCTNPMQSRTPHLPIVAVHRRRLVHHLPSIHMTLEGVQIVGQKERESPRVAMLFYLYLATANPSTAVVAHYSMDQW